MQYIIIKRVINSPRECVDKVATKLRDNCRTKGSAKFIVTIK